MKARHGWIVGALVLAAACGESVTGPTPGAKPLHDGGGLMGSGTRTDPPPSTPAPAGTAG